MNQNGTADIGAELGKVDSVVSPSNFRFPPRKDKRKKDVVKQREGEIGGRGEGEGEREREREAGLSRHMGETAETEGQTEISAADVHVGRWASGDLSLSLSLPSFLPSWGLRTRILLEKQEIIEGEVRQTVRTNRVSGKGGREDYRVGENSEREGNFTRKKMIPCQSGKAENCPIFHHRWRSLAFLLVGNAQSPLPPPVAVGGVRVGGLPNQQRGHSGLRPT